jgi:hypothetical protein
MAGRSIPGIGLLNLRTYRAGVSPRRSVWREPRLFDDSGWYRLQAWRYRLPLFTSVSKYKNLNPVEIDIHEWIKLLGHMERIERVLSEEEARP